MPCCCILVVWLEKSKHPTSSVFRPCHCPFTLALLFTIRSFNDIPLKLNWSCCALLYHLQSVCIHPYDAVTRCIGIISSRKLANRKDIFLVLKQFSQIRRCKWEVNPWTTHILCKMFIHATEKAVFQFIPEYAGKECFRTFALVAFNAGQSIK